MPRDPSQPGLRAVGHGRPPVQLRGRAGHRRAGPPAARRPGRHRGGALVGPRRPATTATTCSTGCGPALEPLAARFFDGLRTGDYDGQLEASTAVRLASQLRYALEDLPARVLPGRARQGRHAERRGRGPHPVADPGHRRADPPGRRDQAPGQDGHRRHLPQRREPAAGPAGGGGAGRGRGPRPADLRVAAGVGRRSTRPSSRWSATPATASRGASTTTTATGDRRRHRPRRHLARAGQPHRGQPRAGGHQAPRRDPARWSRWPAVAATAAPS